MADVELAEYAAAQRRAVAQDERDEALNLSRAADEAVREAERQGNAAELRERELAAAERLADEVREYVRLRVMAALLDRVLAAESQDVDEELLGHASQLVAALTGDRVTAVIAEDTAGVRRLRVEAPGCDEGTADELSEGTADQVFLALRLAGIRQTQQQARDSGGVALPVVLDDVLMAHDDERTAAALDLLVDEARDQQILLFTHHLAVANAATQVGALVVSLDPLPDPTSFIHSAAPRREAAAGDAEEPDPTAVREWARSNGYPVGDRGRLKQSLMHAYLARDAPDILVEDAPTPSDYEDRDSAREPSQHAAAFDAVLSTVLGDAL